MGENPDRPPRMSHGEWPFLRPPERVPEVPIVSREHLPHLEKIQEVLPSRRDAAHFGALTFKPRIDSHHVCTWDSPVGKPRGKDSRENHRSFDPRGGLRDTAATPLEESASACPHSRRGLTPVGRLQKYPKIHVSTGEESSVSSTDSTQGFRQRHRREWNPERPPRNSHGDWPFLRPPERVPEGPVRNLFSLHCVDVQAEDRLPPRVHVGQPCGERIPGVPVASQEEALPQERREELQGRATIPRDPRCVSPFQRNLFSLHCLDVQAEDRLSPRVHVGQPCGKASSESLVGKTGGKTIDPLINVADCVTLLLPLWRKAQVHARIRDED
ncbi:hypothetical protein MJG53_000389 [Ovis ammon polii x Ovis aries]|nr:hypothetical protein MJG53_000389 [Ovis ammon polii x Ovis aries]